LSVVADDTGGQASHRPARRFMKFSGEAVGVLAGGSVRIIAIKPGALD